MILKKLLSKLLILYLNFSLINEKTRNIYLNTIINCSNFKIKLEVSEL